jgi:hypothetical protein
MSTRIKKTIINILFTASTLVIYDSLNIDFINKPLAEQKPTIETTNNTKPQEDNSLKIPNMLYSPKMFQFYEPEPESYFKNPWPGLDDLYNNKPENLEFEKMGGLLRLI